MIQPGYKKQKTKLLTVLIGCFVSLSSSCSSGGGDDIVPKTEPAIHENIDGIRIAWDYSTRVKIAPADDQSAGYYGYARMRELHDGRLVCVYETSYGNIELVFSDDKGASWGERQTIFATENNIAMAVPDLIELTDHSLLVACNPRPRQPYSDDRKFGIKVCKSPDGGQSWDEEQEIYQAQSIFEDGCWEPSFVQLPSGEVQLFFANEGFFTSSSEQNISMFRSLNNGDSWAAEPVVVGFRPGRRDGMPVPLLLEDKGEILVAVEDNKVGEFKPTIYREKIPNNWNDVFISADDSRRSYHPMTDRLADDIYAGAPYLARLEAGEVLLSYQTTLNRSKQWDLSSMAVEIGDESGLLFGNRTIPFDIPITRRGLWNSLAVIDGNTPVAITSTDAWSTNSVQVWMIKGHVIPEFVIRQGTASVDGQLDDACWDGEWPYFVGHKGVLRMYASLSKDQENLYLAARIEDTDYSSSNTNELVFQFDTERKGYEKPHQGIFAVHCQRDGAISIEEGSFGEWEPVESVSGVAYKVVQSGSSYFIELAIPLSLFHSEFTTGKHMGINFQLNYRTKSGSLIQESMATDDPGKPYSWSPLRF
ncbi:sugar-binding protein [Mangrovibacterium diazotrophicum]|uniref:Carbohydrate binding protein with CBM9 domain n=1 Tax=Mangrovibacterium diazotrophicum TaxID=1261403 RepID=A0A419W2X0_9BACT|nr:sugar-binding protein [Mangrovibacterium diazotrophicum]RKD89836.1 carbohydrate binding protein with CBM9 domain [Mangrovibacterium diazotrophicum]